MPVWLRKFTWNKIKEHYDKENEVTSQQPNNSKELISRPNINPSYVIKAPKKQ